VASFSVSVLSIGILVSAVLYQFNENIWWLVRWMSALESAKWSHAVSGWCCCEVHSRLSVSIGRGCCNRCDSVTSHLFGTDTGELTLKPTALFRVLVHDLLSLATLTFSASFRCVFFTCRRSCGLGGGSPFGGPASGGPTQQKLENAS